MKHRTYLWLYPTTEAIREMCRDDIYHDDSQVVSLPKSVEDAYERFWCKISEKQTHNAHQILMIIVGARRPLSIYETQRTKMY